MASIQDGQEHVQIEDWPKLSGVWFLVEVFGLNGLGMAAIFVIFVNGYHPRWMTARQVIKDGHQSSPPLKPDF